MPYCNNEPKRGPNFDNYPNSYLCVSGFRVEGLGLSLLVLGFGGSGCRAPKERKGSVRARKVSKAFD